MAAGRSRGLFGARPIAPKPRRVREPEPAREVVEARVGGELETPASLALDAVAAAAFAGERGRARLAPLLERFGQEVGALAADDADFELLALVRMDWALCDVPAEPAADPGDTWAWRVLAGWDGQPTPLQAAAGRSITGLFEVFPGEPTWVRDRISGLVLRLFDGVGPFPHAEPDRPAALWELRLVPDPAGGGCHVARPPIDYPLELLDALEGDYARRFAAARWPGIQELRRARLRFYRAGGRTPIERMLRWR